MPLFERKIELAKQIADTLRHAAISAERVEQELSPPPNPNLGHVALPCFRLAKDLGINSQALAVQLSSSLSSPLLSAKPAGPYVNFKWDLTRLAASTLAAVETKGQLYGSDAIGKGKKVILEYCSPNVAKKLAFHHIRSTLIGNVLANVYAALGYDVERMNFVGDWGSQFARLLAAVLKWGEAARISERDVQGTMDYLLELYVRFHKELDNDPKMLEAASECLHKMESADSSVMELWSKIRTVSLLAMDKTLGRMTVRFDQVEGESRYVSVIAQVLDEIKKRAEARLSDGAYIVDVEGIDTPALIQKRDGTTLYLTRDIAAAIDRFKRFGFHKMVYIVSEQQKLHFQLLFGVLAKMGYTWSERCEHLSFGTVLFGSEKMSTREGRVVALDGILDEAKRLALVECTEKNPDLANKEIVAEQVGLGAVIFGELSAHRGRDIEFDWKKVLAFDGETGPYAQYAYVRCSSLMAKAKEKNEPIATAKEFENVYEFAPEEEALLIQIARFRSILFQVALDNEPYHLTHYLIDLAKALNRFYYKLPVLQSQDARQRSVRLAFVAMTRQALENGLTLLGVACPNEM